MNTILTKKCGKINKQVPLRTNLHRSLHSLSTASFPTPTVPVLKHTVHIFPSTPALHHLALHCRWCVEAPFFEQTSDSSESLPRKTKMLKTETELDKAAIGSTPPSSSSPPHPSSSASSPPASFKSPPSSETTADLYSQLHLSILQTLQNVPSVRARMTQKQVSIDGHRSSIYIPHKRSKERFASFPRGLTRQHLKAGIHCLQYMPGSYVRFSWENLCHDLVSLRISLKHIQF